MYVLVVCSSIWHNSFTRSEALDAMERRGEKGKSRAIGEELQMRAYSNGVTRCGAAGLIE